MDKNPMSRGKSLGSLLAVAAVSASTACSAHSTSDDDVMTLSQEINESTCATVAPTALQAGGFNYTSPQSYNPAGCSNAVIVDAYPISDTDPPVVRYADSSPSSETGCEAIQVLARLYRDIDPEIGIFAPISTKSLKGDWVCRFRTCSCQRPSVTFGTLNLGEAYRIVAQATNGSGQTRIVSVKN